MIVLLQGYVTKRLIRIRKFTKRKGSLENLGFGGSNVVENVELAVAQSGRQSVKDERTEPVLGVEQRRVERLQVSALDVDQVEAERTTVNNLVLKEMLVL